MLLRQRFLLPVALAGMSACLLFAQPVHAQLAASYQFNNTLAADQSGKPALTPVNSGAFTTDTVFGQSRTVYQRTTGNGASASQSALRLDTSNLGLTSTNYAVQIVFTFTDTFDPRGSSGYRRIVDTFPPASLQDSGFYVGPGNTLSIYQGGPHSGGPVLTDGTYYDVVLSVSAAGEQAYLNGALATSFNGTPDALQSNFLTFFQDDTNEYGNGKIALLRVFNRSLSAQEVSALNNNGNPFTGSAAGAPEPGTIALLAFGAFGGGAGHFLCRGRRSKG